MKQHEEINLHISKRSFYSILIFVTSLILTIGMFYIIIDSWKFLELGDLNIENNYQLYSLRIIPLFLIQYIFINLTICSFISIFKKLKSYKEDGLIAGVIYGLIWVLFVGLIGGLIGELVVGLIWGLIIGLIIGLIGGLINELIAGLLLGEFEK